jgi:Zn-dependent peptidase ImmA (M78 family)/transcriptional regulator with XRE-family HTH domain
MTRTPPAPVTPSVLRWAREDAGLTEAELGALARVDADRVRHWESGDDRPTLGQLRLVADGLRFPVAFFLAPPPPGGHTEQPPDFRTRRHGLSRSLRRELRTVGERRRSYDELVGDEDRAAWLSWRDQPPETPDQARVRLGVSPEAVAKTADPGAALRLWVDAVEAQGVLVFQMSRIGVEECRGFAQYDDAAPVIVLNGADAPQARTFTLLHELAHLLDHSGALCLLDADREVEQRCNRFAAAVLMPAEPVRAATAKLDERDRVEAVARQFRVSPVAAALRLRALDLAGQSMVNAAIRQADIMARKATERDRPGGPAPHVLKRRNLGDRYVGAVLDALARDAITFTDATYYLGTNAATVERMESSLVGGRG